MLSLVACKEEPGGPKFYVSQPAKGGLVRAQAGEVLPYDKTDGYFCMSPEDLDLMLSVDVAGKEQ